VIADRPETYLGVVQPVGGLSFSRAFILARREVDRLLDVELEENRYVSGFQCFIGLFPPSQLEYESRGVVGFGVVISGRVMSSGLWISALGVV
jgi:hypothetical protein